MQNKTNRHQSVKLIPLDTYMFEENTIVFKENTIIFKENTIVFKENME